jgi:hypothetical protein
MREVRIAYNIFVRKLQRKTQLEKHSNKFKKKIKKLDVGMWSGSHWLRM